jgi:beta-aspartyl-peptidase (threonine type)
MAAWDRLMVGASALDAVEAAVRVLEDNPIYDAGRGSYLNRDGRVQLDAIIMDGGTLDFGAVAAVERVLNPVSLARLVMERCAHRLVVGPGAEALAEALGMALCDPAELMGQLDGGGWTPPPPIGAHRRDAPVAALMGDTVGAIALDRDGHIAVATSTGGTPGKWPGRVGDSPLVGCGAYADNAAGAAAATGSGESLMRVVISKAAVDLMATGMPAQEAADAAIARLWGRVRGYGGIISMGADGRIGIAHNTPNLAHAYIREGQSLVSGTEIASTDAPGRSEGLRHIVTWLGGR